MTAAKLKELEAKATEKSPTPELWEAMQLMNDGRDDQYYLNDATDSLVFIEHRSGIPVTSKHRAELIAYLRNHAQDFIKLLEAAEQLVNGGHPDEAIHHMTEALAAFKEKS